MPNLYEFEDRERIVSECREQAVAQGLPDSPEFIYKAFISAVRDHLHIVVCMSPVGNALRVRCRRFPSLVNCCTIDWFDQWKRSALQYVAEEFLVDPMAQESRPPSRHPMSPAAAPVSALKMALEMAAKVEDKQKTISTAKGGTIKE